MAKNTLRRLYIELKNPTYRATHLRVAVSFKRGGTNFFTHKKEEKGVTISVAPVILIDGREHWQTQTETDHKIVLSAYICDMENIFEEAHRAIILKSGKIWNFVMDVAKKEGLKIA